MFHASTPVRLQAALLVSCILLASFVGCRPPAQDTQHPCPRTEVDPHPLAATRPSDYPGLHNVVLYSPGLFSGSMPEGEAGFRSLQTLGVRSIISVDGATPDVALARQHGMRYVHLPIGYDGVSEQRARQIARAIRDLPKPVYVHCHHGKHRSAAALASACVMLGLLSPDQAIQKMKTSGTSDSYRGLYASVASCRADPSAVDAAPGDFPETSRTSGLVEAMVRIDHAFERLKDIERAGWNVPANHPDLVPASEAGQLAEVFRLLPEDPEVRAKSDDFRNRLAQSHARASALERLLVEPPVENRAQILSARLSELARSCKDCHVDYRD